MQSIEKEFLSLYKELIIGTSLESKMIESTNKNYYEMSRNKNTRLDYSGIGGRKRYEEEKNKIDQDMYNRLKSSEFGKEDNIVRCELNREEEFSEVMTQKMALWSNYIVHKAEENSIKYMSDFGYNVNLNKNNLLDADKEKQKENEQKFLKNLGKAYNKFTNEDEYKFAMDKVYTELNDDNFNPNSTTDQNVINLQNLMKETGFRKSANSKEAMKSFIFCLRDQRTKNQLFKAKENFF